MWLKNLKNVKNKLLNEKGIYMDNASATPTDPSVLAEMHCVERLYANPSAIHRLGILARQKIDESRNIVANFIKAQADEIVFTASGTEGDNLAILGVIKAANVYGILKPHIIVSEIEHSAVLLLVQDLEEQNKITATYLKVNSDGLINVKDILDSINEDTVLVSVHLVNNEVGTIEPVKDIVKAVRNYKKNIKSDAEIKYPLVHTDAAQATAFIEINVNSLGVDLLSFNGQKMYGPKGVGVLFVKRGTPIRPVFIGGRQEMGFRPGTESLPQIAGLAQACIITKKRRETDFENLLNLRNYFISELEKIPKVFVYVKNSLVSPHIIMAEFENIFSETLVLYLDARGIYVGSKSACKLDDPNESYVLNALKYAKIGEQEVFEGQNVQLGSELGSVRFSLGRDTKKSDINYVIKNLKDILQILKI